MAFKCVKLFGENEYIAEHMVIWVWESKSINCIVFIANSVALKSCNAWQFFLYRASYKHFLCLWYTWINVCQTYIWVLCCLGEIQSNLLDFFWFHIKPWKTTTSITFKCRIINLSRSLNRFVGEYGVETSLELKLSRMS